MRARPDNLTGSAITTSKGMRTLRAASGFAVGTYAQFSASTLNDLELSDDFLVRLQEIMNSLGKLWGRAAPFAPALGNAIRVAKAVQRW